MAVNKFGRNYILTIVDITNGINLEVTLPYTIQFDITRNTLTSANVCQVRIYNLSPVSRNQIRKNAVDYGDYKQIQLKAGYGDDLATIFQGNISQAWSVREGVDFITQIECFDGGFAFVNGYTSKSFPSGTPRRVIIGSIMRDLPNVSLGKIGSYDDSITRANTYSGSTVSLLKDETEDGFFVDKEVAHALKTSDYLPEPGGLSVISAESGLLGTPVLEQTTVRFDMLFEPKLTVGQQILLDSITEDNFNSLYKVTAVKHRGMISESVGGSVITTGEFFYVGLLSPAF